MRFISWNMIKSWHCNACGACCKHYDVILKFPEWLNIIKTFGVEYTAPNIANFSLRKREDGTCIFLHETLGVSFCGLQRVKPQACKLWPFKVVAEPKYGQAKDAVYTYGDRRLFIYVDPVCPGVRYGVPSMEFVGSVLPEFVEIAMGVRRRQFKSTAVL